MKTTVITYYLEMTDPAQHRRARAALELEVRRAEIICPELNRFLYTAVGGNWFWTQRLPWTHREWLTYLCQPEIQTWIGWLQGTPAGYFELDHRPGTGVEIAYFGLLPQFVGRGLGGALLSGAIDQGWRHAPRRVWLHTCTLDHPRALANYQARGFQLYKIEEQVKELPEQPTGPWPGAGPHSEIER